MSNEQDEIDNYFLGFAAKKQSDIVDLESELEGITRQRDELKRQLDIAMEENCRLRKALEHCLGTLKHHHRSRPGITETIRETERIQKKDVDPEI